MLRCKGDGWDTAFPLSRVVDFKHAPVAQLDRASGYEPEGRLFESARAHHKIIINSSASTQRGCHRAYPSPHRKTLTCTIFRPKILALCQLVMKMSMWCPRTFDPVSATV